MVSSKQLPLRVWVDQGVMAMKRFYKFPEAPDVEPRH